MSSNNTKAAKRMARILGTTVARCEEMLRAGNEAGLSTAYMEKSVEVYLPRNRRRRAVAALNKVAP